MRIVCLVAAAILFAARPCVPQEQASVNATTDIAVLSLGDLVTLTIEVEHQPGQTVTWPALTDTLGPFELVGMSESSTVLTEGLPTSTKRYLLTTFELGEKEIPAIEVSVADSGVADPLVLVTQPIAVLVESVGIDESGDIRNVKSPLEIPRNWLLLLPWGLLIVALSALAYWLYRRYRSREKNPGEQSQRSEPSRPPHEVAYEALERLEAKRLLDRGETKQYYIEVSEIIRTYLEGRYPIDALEMTSYEVLQELKEVGLEPEVFDLFPPFLGRADLVKFAKHRPGQEISKEMIPMARLLIDETRTPDQGRHTESQAEGEAVVVAEESARIG